MQDFRKLTVWQKSFNLRLEIYQLTKSFPKDELYGLTNQLRRASVSIPANIAEGCGRYTNAELVRYLDIAMGSLSEVDTTTQFAMRLGYLSESDFTTIQPKVIEVRRMLIALIQKVRNSNE
jgi:four helix bundle protein